MFNYRVSEALNSITPKNIKLYQVIEVNRLMLKSSKMKEYFATNEKEKKLLLHKLNKLSREYNRSIVKIPGEIPPYLTPSFLKDNKNDKFAKLRFMRKKS